MSWTPGPSLPRAGRPTVGRRALDLAIELAKAIKLCIWEVFRAGQGGGEGKDNQKIRTY